MMYILYDIIQVGGGDGAQAISDILWECGVKKFEFIVDEGLTLLNDIIPGMKDQVALYVEASC